MADESNEIEIAEDIDIEVVTDGSGEAIGAVIDDVVVATGAEGSIVDEVVDVVDADGALILEDEIVTVFDADDQVVASDETVTFAAE